MVLGIASGRHAGMVVAAAVLACAGRAAGQSVVAGPVTNVQFGARYWLVSAPTWQAARNFAPTLDPGARLVSVESLAENDWIGSQFGAAASEKMFIGLSVQGSPAVESWSDGSSSGFRNWAPGQPFGTGHAVLVTASGSKWQVAAANFTAFAVVRAPIDVQVPQDLPTIQAAVNAVRDGRTVLVSPGTHGGFRAEGRRITIRGIGGSGQTSVVAPAVTIDSVPAPGLVLEGFTIRNHTNTVGGALNIFSSVVTVRDVVVRDNSAGDAAGIKVIGSPSTRFERCRFSNNQAGSAAGGRISASTVEFVDCLWDGNSATDASALVMGLSTVRLVNCTIAGNPAVAGAAVQFENNSTVRMRNCIVRDPMGGVATRDIAYSNILGGAAGVGNIDLDAQFEPGPGGAGLTHRLRADSPCVDAGSLAEYLAVSSGLEDLGGSRRAVDAPGSAGAIAAAGGGVGPRIDMGAFEFQPPLASCRGDFDGNGARNVADIFSFLSDWFAGCP